MAVVAAGFFKRPEVSAIPGGDCRCRGDVPKGFTVWTAREVSSAVDRQADNLATFIGQDLWTKQRTVAVLATLRMDSAQELARGTTTVQDVDSGAPAAAGGRLKGNGA